MPVTEPFLFMKRIILFFLFALGIVTLLNSCSKEFSFENKIYAADARGSLTDTFGNCLPDSVHGTFYNGVAPGGDTAYVEIQVQVDSVGNYKIYTDLQNGFMFADSGFFNTTGLTTVLLKPIGTPILQTATNFTITFDTSICNFTVFVQDSTGTGLGHETEWSNSSDTAWSFLFDTTTYNGPFDSAYLGIDSAGAIYLALYGSTAITTDSSLFDMAVLLPNGVIETGTYNTNSGSRILFDDNPSDSSFVYYADKTTGTANTVITIESYDSTSNIATGIFSGTAIDPYGNLVTINNGRFKVKVQ